MGRGQLCPWATLCFFSDTDTRYFNRDEWITATTQIEPLVYYHLADPSRSSLALVDAQGTMSQVLYDPYGTVLSQTLSATLTQALGATGDLAEPDTGLVYLGHGRYYDPLLGRPLQPNPSGGVPTVPQSLNRYAATPLGQPGVGESASGCLAYSVCSELVDEGAGWAADQITQKSIKAAGLAGLGKTSSILGYQNTGRFRIQVTYPGQPEVRTLGTNFRIREPGSYIDPTGRVINLNDFEEVFKDFDPSGQHKGVVVVEELVVRAVDQRFPSLSAKLGRGVLDNAFPFFIDVGFQLYQDWNNPRLTPQRRILRSGVAGGIGLAGGYLVSLVVAPELVVPYLLGSFFVGIALESPFANIVFDVIPGLGELPRNLKPLE